MAWTLRHNRRALVVAATLVLTFHPIFLGLDRYVIPSASRPLILFVRLVSMTLAAGALLLRDSALFARRSVAVSGALIVSAGLSICVMTREFGGLRSPYSNGIMLVMFGAGLVFLWPLRVAATVHGIVVLSYLGLNWRDVLSRWDSSHAIPLSFVSGTAVVVATGQAYAFRRERQTVLDQIRLELAGERIELAAEEIRRRERFKSRFFANITHDLKTPLAMILSPLELMLDGDHGRFSESQRTTLRTIYRNGAQLLKLIGDLLDLSRIEESRLRLRIAELDLAAYLRGLAAQCASLVERKQIRLALSMPDAPVKVWVDRDRIERVLVNLLSNAARFTPSGGRIELGLAADDERATVWVLDSGPGFPAGDATRIFERFFQSERDGEGRVADRGGSGIGLALARELVDLHGGELSASSEAGQGATFTLSLRRGREHFSPDVLERRSVEREVAAERRENAYADFTREIAAREEFRLLDLARATERRIVDRDPAEREHAHTVLVVEDTPDVARLIHLTLHHEMRVAIATDGAQGIELARRLKPDVIVTDLMMPGMDGFELTRHVRADEALRPIPIVMLTARGDLEDRLAGAETGVNAYLTKPFSPKELLATVRANLRRSDDAAGLALRANMASLETVAGGLAHEINNPLNYIKQSLMLLERELARAPVPSPEAAARVETFLKTARSGVTRIGGTVALMQRYAKEGYQREPQPIDLWALVRDVIGIVLPATGGRARVSLQLSGEGRVEGVADELQQVVSNLVQNAIEATTEGAGEVRVVGTSDDADVTLRVTDNGTGIPREDRQRVFRPFFTTKEPGKGTGMGLAIVWRVLHEHRGTISITDAEGGGACFTVRLPRSLAVVYRDSRRPEGS